MYESLMREFHQKQGQPIGLKGPLGTEVSWSERYLRMRLIISEAAELADAIGIDDRVEIADALADLMYVVVGTALTFGMPLHDLFLEVHRSNMTKNAPNVREPGSKGGLKGPNFSPPDIKTILERYQGEINFIRTR